MKLMPCPIHGERNISEFVCRGPVEMMPSMEGGLQKASQRVSQLDWAAYLFFSENKAGEVDEWWCHTPSGLWFVARRDTRNERIVRTWTVEDYKKNHKQRR